MRTIGVFAAACVAATTAFDISNYETEFTFWAAKHGKSYPTMEEFSQRLSNWVEVHLEIKRINGTPGETVRLAHNKFSDLSQAEYEAMLSYRPKDDMLNREPTLLDASDIPESKDWRDEGAVNDVQDQGACGSCWAFSAIAQMEGQHFVQKGELLKLSEQQCVDCDTDSFGCSGGWQDNCMWYVQDNGGISLEVDYPYKAYTDVCFAPYNGPVSVSTVNYVKSYSESQLLAAIAQGPVSVTVDAESMYFRAYSSGVITSEDCGTKLDHAITAVGYGTDEDGNDFYLVRNSWGTGYGDAGYLKIGRNGDGYGICGIQEISVWASVN